MPVKDTFKKKSSTIRNGYNSIITIVTYGEKPGGTMVVILTHVHNMNFRIRRCLYKRSWAARTSFLFSIVNSSSVPPLRIHYGFHTDKYEKYEYPTIIDRCRTIRMSLTIYIAGRSTLTFYTHTASLWAKKQTLLKR